MLTKTLRDVEIKNDNAGTVEAVFATFNAVDSDGDVTLPGAFVEGAPVVISSFGHRSWSGELPVGKGRIRTTSSEAIMTGRFFMDTSHGADAFNTVKALGELQEWSYSLEHVQSHRGTHDGKQVRFLERIHVTEVSPVLKGAGVGTRTLVAKATRPDAAVARLFEQERLRYVAGECRRGIARIDDVLGARR